MHITVGREMEKIEKDGEIRIRFKILKADFGLAAFFGDFKIRANPDNFQESLVTERCFIDSGIMLGNASFEEIEEGLVEDARLIREAFGVESEAAKCPKD